MMYALLRHLLFLLPPEIAHRVALSSLNVVERLKLLRWLVKMPPVMPIECMGLPFPNPVGLAAGLDKNADYVDALAALGFGFIEVGTVTPRPQRGNPQPRLFRLPQANAMINRLGFNNYGVDYLVARLRVCQYQGIIGVNIGKNKDTPMEQAVDDYLTCMRKVYPLASYIAVNISSPNTPGLRDLHRESLLERLLIALTTERRALAEHYGKYVPLAIKVSPDMKEAQIESLAKLLMDHGVDAVIATNTTIDHSAVTGLSHGLESGGLSGGPLQTRSNAVIAALRKATAGQLPIIGVGGIINGENAAAKILAGASLVQLYSGFIYRGPMLIDQAVAAIQETCMK